MFYGDEELCCNGGKTLNKVCYLVRWDMRIVSGGAVTPPVINLLMIIAQFNNKIIITRIIAA